MSETWTQRCVNGCQTRPNADGNRWPIVTDEPALVCRRCHQQLRDWLHDLPARYASLPGYLTPGSAEPDPDRRTPRRTAPPTPVRESVLDLLDERRGRRWQGTSPAEDRRGILGTLESWARMVREERHQPIPTAPATVVSEAGYLLRHLPWIVQQPWVDELHTDLRRVNQAVRDATGDHRATRVGTCPDPDCDGPILISRYDDGCHCPACGATWTHDQLRILGGALTP